MEWIQAFLNVKFFLTVAVSILPIFISKPEKKWLAILCACVIIVTAGVNAVEQYTTKKTSTEIEKYAYDKIYDSTNDIVRLLSQMIFYATYDWFPVNQEEFFSQRTANVICGDLNIDAEAPVFPKMPWYSRIGQETDVYRKSLNEVVESFGQHFESEFINRIHDVESSMLVVFPGKYMLARNSGIKNKDGNRIEFPASIIASATLYANRLGNE